ncbi:MAG TPA: GNAT family N-acetyltransferase [Chloroflexia bacterium]|nr:GNAT family N-acetyltransferase [Chloroflexia bacterium]
MTDTIAFLDELAANAWPPIVQQGLEGWRVRASDGVTRRANSVLSIGPAPTYSDWFEDIEAFYVRRGLPVRFQVSPASPTDLDGFLETRGYKFDAETSVMTAATATVCEHAPSTSPVRVEAQPWVTSTWLDAFLQIEGFPPTKRHTYEHILRSITPLACFVLASDGAQPVGTGLAVAERGWAGLFCIATAESHRRQGIALRIISALADWSQQQGAHNLYLQVTANNKPAVSLYERLSFSHFYSYHYREKA